MTAGGEFLGRDDTLSEPFRKHMMTRAGVDKYKYHLLFRQFADQTKGNRISKHVEMDGVCSV
jgi:hypothetical protein